MSVTNPSNPLLPTYEGYISTTVDALILFEACLSGALNHVPRRPHDRERGDLIKSGSVFIYEEHASGIKRWTDGVSWSPSRILSNFLIYRELEKPFPPGEKKRALKKGRKIPQGINKTEPTSRASIGYPSSMDAAANGKDGERSLIGSLIDSYPFKEDGLVKKTISITYQGVPHHLVSYYNIHDVQSGRLLTPHKDSRLRALLPRHELLHEQSFRNPVDEGCDHGSDGRMVGMYMAYPGQAEFTPPGSILQRALSLPNPNQPTPYDAYQGGYQFTTLPPPTAPQPQQPHYIPASAPPPMHYQPAPQSNYVLEPSRHTRFPHPDSGLVSDFGSWSFETMDNGGQEQQQQQQQPPPPPPQYYGGNPPNGSQPWPNQRAA